MQLQTGDPAARARIDAPKTRGSIAVRRAWQGGLSSSLWSHRYTLLSWLTVATFLTAWWLVTTFHLVELLVLPSPQDIASEFRNLLTAGYSNKPLYEHIKASALRSMTGLLGGIAIGIPLGLLMGYYQTVSAILRPIFSFLRPIPPIAFIPLVILAFGIGEFSKILLIFVASLSFVVLNTSAGMRSVPDQLLRAGKNLGLSQRQLFTSVMFPAALPHIMTGVRTATVISWAIVVAAELIAAQSGLGYIIQDAGTFFRITDVYIGIIIIGLIGLTLELILLSLERRLLHWQGK